MMGKFWKDYDKLYDDFKTKYPTLTNKDQFREWTVMTVENKFNINLNSGVNKIAKLVSFYELYLNYPKIVLSGQSMSGWLKHAKSFKNHTPPKELLFF